MPATSIWDGSVWQPIQGLEGADGTDGQDGATGPQGDKGDQGDQGIPGPSSVSTDAGNITTLGSDQLIYTPDNYLPLTGGTLTGDLTIHRDGANRPQLRLQHDEGVSRFFDIKFLDGDTVSLSLDQTDTIQIRSPSVVSFHGSGTEFNQAVDHKGFQINNVPSLWGVSGLGLNLVASFQAGDGVEIATQEGTAAQFFDVGISMYKPMNISVGTLQTLSLRFLNDATTGIYSAAAGDMTLVAGGLAYASVGVAQGFSLYNLGTHASNPFLRRSVATGEVYYDSSSRDIKENIEPLGSVGGLIDQLVPVSFTMIEHPDDGTLYGFVAEDVHDVVSYGTAFDADGKIVNYESRVLAAMMMKEIQELRGRVKTLENER